MTKREAAIKATLRAADLWTIADLCGKLDDPKAPECMAARAASDAARDLRAIADYT